jgi:hypothetical protein
MRLESDPIPPTNLTIQSNRLSQRDNLRLQTPVFVTFSGINLFSIISRFQGMEPPTRLSSSRIAFMRSISASKNEPPSGGELKLELKECSRGYSYPKLSLPRFHPPHGQGCRRHSFFMLVALLV